MTGSQRRGRGAVFLVLVVAAAGSGRKSPSLGKLLPEGTVPSAFEKLRIGARFRSLDDAGLKFQAAPFSGVSTMVDGKTVRLETEPAPSARSGERPEPTSRIVSATIVETTPSREAAAARMSVLLSRLRVSFGDPIDCVRDSVTGVTLNVSFSKGRNGVWVGRMDPSRPNQIPGADSATLRDVAIQVKRGKKADFEARREKNATACRGTR